MTKYINSTRDRTTASFVQTEPTFDGTVVDFKLTSVNPSVAGVVVPMVKGLARISKPHPVESCNPNVCSGSINQAVTVEFNLLNGNKTSFEALRTEVNRVIDAAILEYNLLNGIVPPVSAAFASE